MTEVLRLCYLITGDGAIEFAAVSMYACKSVRRQAFSATRLLHTDVLFHNLEPKGHKRHNCSRIFIYEYFILIVNLMIIAY
jgi:hypothetical protein